MKDLHEAGTAQHHILTSIVQPLRTQMFRRLLTSKRRNVARNLSDDLDKISASLRDILAEYSDTCAKLRDQYFQERASEKRDELLNHVASEIELVASYGVKLKQAESSMKVVRNSSPSIVSISILPPEILSRIFHIILDDQPEPLDATNPFQVPISFPKHPQTLTHVCSSWRQIAIASRTLWTRIDLLLHHSLGAGFLARAQAHVKRAGKLPLDVHMFDPFRHRNSFRFDEPHEFDDYDFLAFGNTPMSSLYLVSYHGLHNEHYNFICYCILNCAQRTLKQIVIRSAGDYGGSQSFIEPASNPHDPKSLQINMPEQSLEAVWHSTSVLHLAGLYPYWTSQAYHQLVDLRLGSDRLGGRLPMTESQIVDILKASPGLRILHLRLDITSPLPEDAPISAVRLDELESLNLSSTEVEPSQVLRHIIPGQKPLRLSIHDEPTDVVEEFLRRSNVTELRLVFWQEYPPVNVLCLCPNLRVLVLDVWGSRAGTNFQTTPAQGDADAPATPIPIQTLHILRCQGMELTELQQIVETHSVQELILWDTYPKVNVGRESGGRNANPSDVSALCPVVNYIRGRDKNPIDDWDFF